MKVLVIGGSGFVGSRLLSEVNIDHFKNLDRRNSHFFNKITTIGDIRKIRDISSAFQNVSHVILLAAEHRDDVSPIELYYDVNVKGTANVLKMMDIHGVSNLIFTSSVAVYGLNKDNPNEDHPVDPFNHYGKSKWKAELLIKEWYENNPKNKSVNIIRPTVIFGERNRGNVYNLLKQISSGKFLMVGKGINKKSMAYVGNIVAFILFLLEKKNKGYYVYNYSDKPDLNMNNLVSQIEKSLNKKNPSIKIPYILGYVVGLSFDLLSYITKSKYSISSVRVKKFCATTQFDASKLKKEFNPPFSLEEGLDRTLKYEFKEVKNNDDVVFFSE